RRRHTRFKCDWSSDVCSSDLDPQILLLRGERDFVITSGPRIDFHRRIAQAVLHPQFLGDTGVDLVDRLRFRHFKHVRTSFPRNTLQNFLAIDMCFLREASPASSRVAAMTSSWPTASPASRPTSAAAHPATVVIIAAAPVMVRICE